MSLESRITTLSLPVIKSEGEGGGHDSRIFKGRRLASALAIVLVAGCAGAPVAEPEALQRKETTAQTAVAVAPPPAPVQAQTLPAQAPTPAPPSGRAVAEALQAAHAPQAEAEPAQAPQPQQPPPPPNMWDRVRAGFTLPDLNGPLVQEWESYYSSRPDYVARMMERGGMFLYYVMEEVERRKMPSEIALLPMIESAYNPQAYSRSHAAGMWQFIPSTGRLYGLRQNFWYDGRRDVLAATSAALDYLEKLYAQFGDWNLALAAYNWGEGAVSRAIARNQATGRPTDYESLAMPLETRKYVPKLQAVKNIVANPGRYGIVLAEVPNRPYFATVTTDRHIDVTLAASLAEMELEDFKLLNPAHNKPVIRANGTEAIVLPIARVEVFQRNLEAYDEPFVTWQAYTVKRSDNPQKIAAKYGLTLAKLKAINGVPPRKRIVPGQTLMVPLKGGAEPHLPDLPAPKLTASRYKPRKAKCYVVSNSGAKKQVRCAGVPAKKRPAAVKKHAPATPRSTSAADVAGRSRQGG